MQRISIYDMDKTITRKATWTPFLLHAARSRAPWRLVLLPALGVLGVAHLAGLLSRSRLKEHAQRLMIGEAVPGAQMDELADRFADRIVANGLHPTALRQIAGDGAAGRLLVLATASCRYYAEPIAARLGFDAVIATDMLRGPNGEVLARIDGENCYGPAKLRMIAAWLDTHSIAHDEPHIRFYTDHVSDEPTLAWADMPIAVNAHRPLRKMAEERGWLVLNWRER